VFDYIQTRKKFTSCDYRIIGISVRSTNAVVARSFGLAKTGKQLYLVIGRSTTAICLLPISGGHPKIKLTCNFVVVNRSFGNGGGDCLNALITNLIVDVDATMRGSANERRAGNDVITER